MRLQRFAGNPILKPNPDHPWESLVTTNPGAWFDEADGLVKLLYRCAGDDEEHVIHFGLAVSRDGYTFERVGDQPVFSPSRDGFDAGCVEDARVVKLGDWLYITYATRPFPPGRYWEGRPPVWQGLRELPEEFPLAIRGNETATGLLLTQDFSWLVRAGRITSPRVDDRDVILFPEKIGGRFVLLHRPMSWCGEGYPSDYPSMWLSFSDDLLDWQDSRFLATGKFAWEGGKIGGNTPPLRTEHGWLHLYHAVGADQHYRLGAMLFDLEDPSIVRYRTRDWLLQPEEWYELEGYYPGVCFPCGKVVLDDTLFVYYGGADKYVGLATCPMAELMDYLLSCPDEPS